MSTTAVQLPGLVPPSAAPVSPFYKQFKSVGIPSGSGALRAWKGTIQPFANDDDARQIFRRLESNRSFQIDDGRLYCDELETLIPHPIDPFLIGMDIKCEVLVLEFSESKHPRAFLLSPAVSTSSLSWHPHLRIDKRIRIGRYVYPALCIFSGAEFQYSADIEKLVQFFDQTATYLARHIIWLRTRILLEVSLFAVDKILYKPLPGISIVDTVTPLMRQRTAGRRYWTGYWPGKIAPSGAAAHLQSIRSNQECWCWSGKPYKLCCQPRERLQIARK